MRKARANRSALRSSGESLVLPLRKMGRLVWSRMWLASWKNENQNMSAHLPLMLSWISPLSGVSQRAAPLVRAPVTSGTATKATPALAHRSTSFGCQTVDRPLA